MIKKHFLMIICFLLVFLSCDRFKETSEEDWKNKNMSFYGNLSGWYAAHVKLTYQNGWWYGEYIIPYPQSVNVFNVEFEDTKKMKNGAVIHYLFSLVPLILELHKGVILLIFRFQEPLIFLPVT